MGDFDPLKGGRCGAKQEGGGSPVTCRPPPPRDSLCHFLALKGLKINVCAKLEGAQRKDGVNTESYSCTPWLDL